MSHNSEASASFANCAASVNIICRFSFAFDTISGSPYIPSQINLDNQDGRVKLRVGSSIVRDSKTGDVIVKLVNLLPVSIETDVRLPGMDGIQSSATRTVLAGAPETTPLPVTDTIEAGTSFKQELPAYSFTVIRLKTQKGKNKQ